MWDALSAAGDAVASTCCLASNILTLPSLQDTYEPQSISKVYLKVQYVPLSPFGKKIANTTLLFSRPLPSWLLLQKDHYEIKVPCPIIHLRLSDSHCTSLPTSLCDDMICCG